MHIYQRDAVTVDKGPPLRVTAPNGRTFAAFGGANVRYAPMQGGFDALLHWLAPDLMGRGQVDWYLGLREIEEGVAA